MADLFDPVGGPGFVFHYSFNIDCFKTRLSLLWSCVESMFVSNQRIVIAVFNIISVISEIRAWNVTERLQNYTQFTSKGLGNLTAFNLTSVLLYSRVARKSCTIENIISPVNNSDSSSSALCYNLKQQPLFRGKLQEGSRFASFYKVRGWLVLGVVLTGIIFLVVTSGRRSPRRCNAYCRMIC